MKAPRSVSSLRSDLAGRGIAKRPPSDSGWAAATTRRLLNGTHRRSACAAILPLLWALTSSVAPALDRAADPRPNLVFVFSDQQSSDMLGCAGNPQVISPNLDRLAAQGLRFNHCISSAPICTPYRGMLLSGQHPLRNGAFENDVRMVPGAGNYFGEVLRDHNYRTGYYGKWHLYGGDRDRPVPPGPYRYGFDHEFVINNCTLDYTKG